MLAQHARRSGEIDLALADLQALAVEALGVADVEVRGMRTELREAFIEIEAEMIGGELRVRDVDAHPQVVLGAERGEFVREHEDVLVPLTAEMPGERRHVLRDQLDAVQIELARDWRRRCGSTPPSFREGRVRGEAADIGDDQRALVLGKNFFSPRVMSMTRLGLFER